MTQEKKQHSAAPRKKTAGKKSAIPVAGKEPMEASAARTGEAASVLPKTRTKTKPRTKTMQVSLEDIIRLRAYEIYLQRGATPGNPHEDWNVAEREVRAHFGEEADA